MSDEKTKLVAVPAGRQDSRRWVCAIQKVARESIPFWNDYGKRYNEQVVFRIVDIKENKGRKCLDVMVFTCRELGDVVWTAWNEYNDHIIEVMTSVNKPDK